MKKTIAILLVLVIGMVGVFAADPTDATLNLETTIALVNRLAITDSLTSTYTFGTDPDAISVDFNPSSAFNNSLTLAYDVSNVTAAYIHYKTNNANGVEITFKATALVNQSNTDLLMPYKMVVGNASVTALTAAATPASGYIFDVDNTTSMVEDSETVTIEIPGTSDDYAAGIYQATVTFEFTAS